MERDELTYYLALHLTTGIGSRRLIALCQYFGSAERAFLASTSDILRVPGFGKGIADALVADRDEALIDAKKQLERLPQDASVVTYYDDTYPEQLKSTYSPPALLFVRGNAELLRHEKMIAIVGSRKTTDYGRRNAEEFASAMAKQQVCVVSGFAKGIDTAAHHAAFEAGGTTIGVLGSGVDVIYPNTNWRGILPSNMIVKNRSAQEVVVRRPRQE